jgi:hypothetical protein
VSRMIIESVFYRDLNTDSTEYKKRYF